jgi:UDP-N-acetylglucosamine:LPS N-acetylglucosamine transferase
MLNTHGVRPQHAWRQGGLLQSPVSCAQQECATTTVLPVAIVLQDSTPACAWHFSKQLASTVWQWQKLPLA